MRTELLAAAVLFAFALAYKLWLFSRGPITDGSLASWHFALPEFLDYFAIGMALAAVSVDGRGAEWLGRRPWLAWLGAAALFAVVSKGIGLTGGVFDHVTEARYLARHYLYAGVALLLVLPAMFGDPEEGLLRRVLGWRPLLWIGLVSYGAYLYHFAWLEQLGDWRLHVWPYLWFPIGLAGALVLAAVSWYGFERPLLTLKRLVPTRAAADTPRKGRRRTPEAADSP